MMKIEPNDFLIWKVNRAEGELATFTNLLEKNEEEFDQLKKIYSLQHKLLQQTELNANRWFQPNEENLLFAAQTSAANGTKSLWFSVRPCVCLLICLSLCDRNLCLLSFCLSVRLSVCLSSIIRHCLQSDAFPLYSWPEPVFIIILGQVTL